MADILPFLKSLLSAPGLSAYETPVMRLIEEKWRPLVTQTRLSRIGSLEALKQGAAAEPRPALMVATHMDAIGLMVTSLAGEFLHVTQVGGIDPRILPGTPVTVHGRADLPGVVVMPPARALPPGAAEGVIALNDLLVDVGLSARELAEQVQIGDVVSFATQPVEMPDGIISGHTLDNRASVAVMTVALEELQAKQHAWDVWAVATSQEETTLGGAFTSAFGIHPQIAIAVDVTFAKGPGASDWQTFPLGKGPTLAMGPNMHPFLHKKLKEIADRLEIPTQLEFAPRHSGTDAYAMQVAADGIPTMLIGIPLRYMHTPVEMVAVKDIQRAGRLLAEFAAALEPDFAQKIVWDD